MFDKPPSAEGPATEPCLLGDAAAALFELEAHAALDAAPLLSSSTASLAGAVILLTQDRRIRAALAHAEVPWNSIAFFDDMEHLAAKEAGAYALLILCAWRIGPLPLDTASLLAKAGLPEAQLAHAEIPLRAFFEQTPVGWVHRRIDAERNAWLKRHQPAGKGGM